MVLEGRDAVEDRDELLDVDAVSVDNEDDFGGKCGEVSDFRPDEESDLEDFECAFCVDCLCDDDDECVFDGFSGDDVYLSGVTTVLTELMLT